jgi:hypothetical protein
MYINQIDDYINNILNRFYNKIIATNFLQTLNDINFVKHQNQILKFIYDFTESITHKEIINIVKNEIFVPVIINIIKRYCAYFIYLSIAYHYKGDHSLFIVNLIESSKYQKDATIQIDNFFNSDTNSKIIQFFYDIKNLLSLFEFKSFDKIRILLKNNPLKYQSTYKIITDLGEDYIINILMTDNNLLAMIKTLIATYIYDKEDKLELIKLLTFTEKDNAEYKYIEIIVSNKKKIVDYTSIHKILTTEQINSGLAQEIYDYINDTFIEQEINMDNTNYGLQFLFINNILVPITEDYLRFHKDNEKYDNVAQLNIKDRDATKIKYIVNKFNNINNYYSPILNNNPKLKLQTTDLFLKQADERKAVVYNDTEDLRILSKLELSTSSSDYNYTIDLQNMRKYAYMNFKDFSKPGFKLRVPKTIECIRYTSISNKMFVLETRIGHDIIDMNVVGVAYNPSKLLLSCIDYTKLIDVRKHYNNKNGYLAFLYALNNTNKKVYYWLFNNNDNVKTDSYIDTNITDSQSNINIMIEQIYIKYTNMIKSRCIKYIDKLQEIKLSDIHTIMTKFNIYNLHINDINLIQSYAINTKLLEYPIIIEDIVKTKNIKLPSIKKEIINNNIIKIGYEEIDVTLKMSDSIIPICIHYLKWSQLLRQSRNSNIEQMVFDFVKKYAIFSSKGEYLCKSCNEGLNLYKYVRESTYINDEMVSTSIVANVKFIDDPLYSKYIRTINNIEKMIEKIASLVNLSMYIGNIDTVRFLRKQMIKNTIDLILLHTEWLKKQPNTRNEEYNKKYNTNYSNLFFFDLKDDIFLTSSTDIDQYKMIKYNNIIIYLIFLLISEMNYGQIISFKENKKYNYFIFTKIGITLFSDLYLRKNKKEKILITDIPILAYTIYYITGILLDNNIWLWKNDNNDIKNNTITHKHIIHTLIDLLNTISEINFETTKNYMYEIIAARFLFDKLKNVFGDTMLLKHIEKETNKYIKYDTTTNKLTIITKKIQTISVTENTIVNTIVNTLNNKEKLCMSNIREIKKNDYYSDMNNISLITNCSDGKFHEYIFEDNDLICTLCKQSYNLLIKLTKIDNSIEKLKLINLKKLAMKYCITGDTHDIYNNNCNKCKRNITTELNDKELLIMEKNITNKNYEENLDNINKYKSIQEKHKHNKSMIKDKFIHFIKLYENNTKNQINMYIDDFIDRLARTVDNNIKETIYIINHDYMGNIINKPIKILSSSNKINIRYHDEFKKNILYYKNNSVYVYYDVITYQYLGYSDDDKTIKTTTNIRSIEVIMSLRDILYLLGYQNQYINLYHMSKDFQNNILNTNEIIYSILRERANNLRHIITRFKSIIYSIKNKHKISNMYNIIESNIINEYTDKIKYIKTNNINGDEIFNDDYIINKLQIKKNLTDNTKIEIIRTYINISKFNSFNNIDTYLLFYLIYNLNIILNNNTQVEIVQLIIQIIIYLFNTYYIPYTNYHIQKFDTLLFVEPDYFDDYIVPSGMYQELLTNEEINNPERMEEIYTNEEEKTSLDIDDYDDDPIFEE